MGLIDDLPPGPVAVDTAPFIYFAEDHPRWAPLIAPLFAAADRGEVQLVTSEVTLLEVLVAPLRRGDAHLAERYETLLSRSRGLTLVPLGRTIFKAAAQLRASYPIRVPDALQVAAALAHECRALITNDRRLPPIPGLRVIQLAEYHPGRAEG